MELQVGDRIVDETGEWEMVARPFTSAAGKNAHARVRKVGRPQSTDLNPLQTRRYRDVVRRKAKTDDIDAHVIAGLLRSGAAQASYVPDEQIQSLRELARLRARLLGDRQDYLRQLIAQLDVVLPEHRAVLGDLLTARARGILAQFPTAQHLAHANPFASGEDSNTT